MCVCVSVVGGTGRVRAGFLGNVLGGLVDEATRPLSVVSAVGLATSLRPQREQQPLQRPAATQPMTTRGMTWKWNDLKQNIV